MNRLLRFVRIGESLADLALALALAMLTSLAMTAVLFLLMPLHAVGAEEPPQWSTYGKVVRVIDGDTLLVKTDENNELSVDLWGIDSPELGQPNGDRAKKYLEDLIEKTRDPFSAYDVWIKEELRKKDGTMLGTVYVVIGHSFPDHSRLAVGREIHYQIICDGFAWHDKKHTSNDEELAAAEKKAREAKRGLWATERPLPPWEWRKKHVKERTR